jgi:protein-tyrosine sulfotransferase
MSVGALSSHTVEAVGASKSAPVIVIAYAGSGVDRLRSALSGYPELACTQQTGILPLFHNLVTTWQAVEGTSGAGVSPLAAASMRALSAGLMTAILARQRGSRWCEFATAPPAAAQSFARVFPQARFLVLHRRADSVARAILKAHEWGLNGPEFAPFVSAHPGSSVAALTSFWANHTTQQLEFEQSHADRCHRVRFEDLITDTAQTLLGISDFLALDDLDGLAQSGADERQAGHAPVERGLPTDRIPTALLARVNELHRELGYPPVTDAGA